MMTKYQRDRDGPNLRFHSKLAPVIPGWTSFTHYDSLVQRSKVPRYWAKSKKSTKIRTETTSNKVQELDGTAAHTNTAQSNQLCSHTDSSYLVMFNPLTGNLLSSSNESTIWPFQKQP